MSPRKSQALEANATALLIEEQDMQARRAYELRQTGMSWWSIADELGIPIAKTQTLVADAMAQAAELVSNHAKAQLLMMEVATLDAIQQAHWKAATEWRDTVDKDGNRIALAPDIRAAQLILSISAKRAEYLKLSEADAGQAAVRTVVVAGNQEQYVAALRLIAGGGGALEGEVVDGRAS